MPDFKVPGVYVEEINPRIRAIEGMPTTVAALVGFAERGPLTPTLITSFAEYLSTFGGFSGGCLPYAVQGFFQNGGQRCYVLRLVDQTPPSARGNFTAAPRVSIKVAPVLATPKLAPEVPINAAAALIPLASLGDVSIVCCPDEHAVGGMTAALVAHCEELRYRIAVLAAPQGGDLFNAPPPEAQSSYAAYYAPWLMVANPAGGAAIPVHPGGHIAGAMVGNDLRHGVFRAPANLAIAGIVGLERQITDQQQAASNPRGVNVLRNFPGRGNLIWGARTTSNDAEWKYVNVRRYFIYLEQSISQGTQWVVFEPNGEQLWSNVRQAIGNFLLNEWRSGALQGNTPDQAYVVRCDKTTMTQSDLDNGQLVCVIGVAPLKPAEFVIIRIGQWTADHKSS